MRSVLGQTPGARYPADGALDGRGAVARVPAPGRRHGTRSLVVDR